MSNLNFKSAIALAVFLGVAGYFLWQEHSAHIAMAIPYLPYLLILLCPLMHIFMHHGHGHGNGTRNQPPQCESDGEPSARTSTAPHARHGSLPDRERRHD